ncbi:hypothetical protein BDR22DRAFT_839613 [Usnea florida]
MQAPFEKEHELFSHTATLSATPSPSAATSLAHGQVTQRLIVPAVHEGKNHSLRYVNPNSDADLQFYLKSDLDVDGLNKIHKHLWFAGLPRCARPLHYQLMIGRKIVITERADLHLLWGDGGLFLKPLPDYLLSYNIWERTLLKDNYLFENAKGFLLSYLWLIRHKSDFVIAQRENLVNIDLTWEQWTKFSTTIFTTIASDSLDGINPRYLYGELRLGRVNLIYRFCRETRSFEKFIRGYFYGYHTYSSFIEKNFAWVLTVIVYITIVLTAMQVGLGTTELQNSKLFNRASYGFTVFSIMAPLGILLVLLLVLLILIVFNLIYALSKRRATWRKYTNVFSNMALQTYNH